VRRCTSGSAARAATARPTNRGLSEIAAKWGLGGRSVSPVRLGDAEVFEHQMTRDEVSVDGAVQHPQPGVQIVGPQRGVPFDQVFTAPRCR
jgi:hypothetical protein